MTRRVGRPGSRLTETFPRRPKSVLIPMLGVMGAGLVVFVYGAVITLRDLPPWQADPDVVLDLSGLAFFVGLAVVIPLGAAWIALAWLNLRGRPLARWLLVLVDVVVIWLVNWFFSSFSAALAPFALMLATVPWLFLAPARAFFHAAAGWRAERKKRGRA